MEYFYENLSKGFDKDEALRLAKLSYMENVHPLKTNPAFWAGFVVLGNTEPIQEKPYKLWLAMALTAIVVGVVIQYLYRSSAN
jgi:hypothetical protein